AGLGFTNGAFYYHAWAESFVGTWIDVDPTLPSAFVDATHIKLARGDVQDLINVAKVMGNLKAHIVEYN
ncbi:MAG: transglutaminase domain-containing protein, partial [Armatimonadota bacterium]